MTMLKAKSNRATSVEASVADPNATVALTGELGCEAECPLEQNSADGCEDVIRSLAYSEWEAAGRPAGDGFDFWLKAEREVREERSRSSSFQG